MTKFEEEFNYLIELSGKVLIGQVDAEEFEKNRVSFFEKYETDQQQALPVVPECVAEWYKEHKYDLDFSIFEACVSLYDDSSDFKKWFGNSGNKSIETLVRMKDGYKVEKPQMFYLKNKLTGMYLYKKALGGYGEDPSSSIKNLTDDFKFTQSELDSMETGGYEQIEVEE